MVAGAGFELSYLGNHGAACFAPRRVALARRRTPRIQNSQ